MIITSDTFLYGILISSFMILFRHNFIDGGCGEVYRYCGKSGRFWWCYNRVEGMPRCTCGTLNQRERLFQTII